MNRKLAPAFVLILVAALGVVAVFPTFASTADFWTAKTRPPTPLASMSGQAAALNGQIYALCGWPPSQLEMYNIDNDSWTNRTSPPKVGLGQLVTCGNRIYAIGGGNNFNALQAYDPANDSWEPKAKMPSGLAECQAVAVDDKIYVMGGIAIIAGEYIAVVDANLAYDSVSNTWSGSVPMPIAAARFAAAVVDGEIYVIGGAHTDGWARSLSSTNAVQVFDPKNNSWSQAAPLGTNLSYLAGCATTGLNAPKRIYVIGGLQDNGSSVNWNQIYDPQTGNWSFGAPIPEAAHGLSLVNVNDTLYALGSSGGTMNKMYTPSDWAEPTPSPLPSTSPSPSVPEFPIWLILPFSLATVIIGVINSRRTKFKKYAFPESQFFSLDFERKQKACLRSSSRDKKL